MTRVSQAQHASVRGDVQRLRPKFFNTLSRRKELFRPAGTTVKLYTCGPTVYNFAHIGNLRSYIFSDILRRSLEFGDFRVRQVMNITDVGHLTSDADQGEDKLQKQAQKERKTAWDVAQEYTKAFQDHIAALNILPPHTYVKATDTIADQIKLVETLEKKGYTYSTSDGVYFDTSKVKDYGKLARLNTVGQEEGSRVKKNAEKKNATDFALWKFSRADERRDMEWDSPWGTGFPGWHIECSAISMKALKTKTLDIHTGGIDHIPVHHTNEIAQSEAATGKPFVRFWMHGAFLVRDKAKMAKSAGNFLTLDSMTKKGFDPLDYRFFVLQTHYRQELAYSEKALKASAVGLAKLRETVNRLQNYHQHGSNATIERALKTAHKKATAAIEDDLNMPKVLGSLFQIAKTLNSAMNARRNIPKKDALALFAEYDRILAVELLQNKTSVPSEVRALANTREDARKRRDFEAADKLRGEIASHGWTVKDTPDGPKLQKK